VDFDVSLIVETLPRLAEGAWLTLELVGLAVMIGFVIAVPIAILRTHDSWLVKGLPYAYVFFFRGTPLLVQIFLIYHGPSQFPGLRQLDWWNDWVWPVLREPYWCAIIAFALNTGAYSAEIIRGAILAVPRGEIEAARAVGMTRAQTLRRVVLPRAFRIGLPAYGNEIVFMIKGSALASTITLMELTGVARTVVARTYKPVEVFLAAGVIYLVIVYGVTWLLKRLEKRWSKGFVARRGATPKAAPPKPGPG